MNLELEQMIKEIRKAANIPDTDIEFNRKIGEIVFRYTINTKYADEMVGKAIKTIVEIIGMVMPAHNNRVFAQGGMVVNNNDFLFDHSLEPHPAPIGNLPEPLDWFWTIGIEAEEPAL